MEYFVGAFVAIAAWLVASKTLQKDIPKLKIKKVTYRQSHLFEIIKPVLPYMPVPIKKPDTQSFKDQAAHMMRFLVLHGKAYWISQNAVYSADVTENGIDEDSKVAIDTTHMDDVQLKEIEFIVDKLNEGKTK
jgi:hypothetical protein